MDIFQTIKERRSVRTYKNIPLNKDTAQRVSHLMAEASQMALPFSSTLRFFEIELKKKERPGTYGVIKHAPLFIGGTCANSHTALIDFGYAFEKLILDLTAHNLGTCWLAGTFNRKTLNTHLKLEETEIIPAISPVGYFEDTRIFENLMRAAVKADKRLAASQLFFHENTAQAFDNTESEALSTALEALRLAPSASNKQPWRVIFNKELTHCDFYANYAKSYENALGFPVQKLDMGIAMYHFEAVLKAFDIQGHFEMRESRETVAAPQWQYVCSFVIRP